MAAPALLVLTVAVAAVPAALDAAARHPSLGFLGLVTAVIDIGTIGFYGTQRVWLLWLYRGRSLSSAEAWVLTKGYFRRFASLGLGVFLPLGVVVAAIGAATRSATAVLVTGGILAYILDMLLTFVVSELTFRTPSAKEAWTSGRALLKDTWPESRWYVLAPGLAVLAVANVLGGSHRSVWVAAVEATVAAVLSLVFRGAILSYYLRLRPDIPDYEPTRNTPATG